jgi:hypothetical protein
LNGKVFLITSQKQNKIPRLLDWKKLINYFKLPALKYPDIYFQLEKKVLGEAVIFYKLHPVCQLVNFTEVNFIDYKFKSSIKSATSSILRNFLAKICQLVRLNG